MFSSQRRQILDESFWAPERGRIAYLETWKHSRDDKIPSHGYREGKIRDDELESWLYGRQPEPSIRLLFCDRVGWMPLGFALSDASYVKLEESFGLGDQVLPMISKNGGQQMCRLHYSSKDVLESVEFTVKWPQMYQIGNCGLAFKYNFSTQTTVGFLHGWDMASPTDQIPVGDTFYLYTSAVRDHITPARSLMSHPMILPVVLLAEHVKRAEKYKDTLARHIAFLEQELGVTRVGQSSWRTTKQFAAIQRLISNRRDRMNLTAELNSCVTDATNFGTVLEWIVRHAQFLEKHKDTIQGLRPHPDVREHRTMEEYLACVTDDAISLKLYVEALKARFELQLSVLYNFVAQVDNDLNMRIAYRAGLDGTAMKTLAYVTTIFLPPTFIATLFSMSMFDWQASTGSASGDSVVVVPDFWIYWVVSVPLTLAILAGWRLWLRREKDALLAEYGISQQQQQEQQHHHHHHHERQRERSQNIEKYMLHRR